MPPLAGCDRIYDGLKTSGSLLCKNFFERSGVTARTQDETMTRPGLLVVYKMKPQLGKALARERFYVIHPRMV
jgi:hypothetical protein